MPPALHAEIQFAGSLYFMSVLLCDSNCELWYTDIEKLGIDFIPMPYVCGDSEYLYDLGRHTDFAAFYSAVRSGAVPKTQALNPDNYKDIIGSYFSKGQDVLYICFSKAMSGTFAQLDKALAELKEQYPGRKCTVFDTKSISLGAGIQVMEAAKLKNRGASDEEIIAFLNEFTNRVAVYFVVDDLMHLKRGGRLSAASAAMGTLLSIKPVLTFNSQGGLSVIEKVTGRRKAIRNLAEKVARQITGFEYPVYVLDADCKEEGDQLAGLIRERRPEANVLRQTVGPVIGAHCGPGTLGVIFIADRRPIPLENVK